MSLDIEIAGPVRELEPHEVQVANKTPTLKRLRDSHHAVAKLLSCGMSPLQVSLQTGYAPSRISSLQNDPAFQELMAFYAQNKDVLAQEMEAMFVSLSRDAMQALQERILDDAESMSAADLRETAKVFADRAGFAPISRSINKNLNVNFGDRLDAAREKLKKDAA